MTLFSSSSTVPRPWIFRLGILFAVLGAAGLTLTGIGTWTPLGDYPSFDARPWEEFDPALAGRTRNLNALFEAARRRNPALASSARPADAMAVLFDVASARFTHGDRAEHTLFGNWMMYILGRFSPKFLRVRNPDTILGRGHSALCSEISYTLMRLAERSGSRGRLASLGGHVVMEAYYDGQWHMYDADLEVAVSDPSGKIMSVEELSRDPQIPRKAYSGRGKPEYADEVARIFTTTGDNTYVDPGPKTRYAGLSPRLERFEAATEVMKILIPATALAIGILMVLIARPSARRKQP